MGMTAVAGVLKCGEGPTLALRFDIDALGLIEESSSSHYPFTQALLLFIVEQCMPVDMMDILRLDLQQLKYL